MSSVIQELESLGVGVFLTHQGVESRVTEPELWRTFEQPVVIWVHGAQFGDSGLERLIGIVRKLPHIRRFRFTSTRVTPDGVRRLYEYWPDIPIEGVAVNQPAAGNAGIVSLLAIESPCPGVPEPER